MKCDKCEVTAKVNKSKEPSCCKWYMDHVVCGNESQENCPVYRPAKRPKKTSRTTRNKDRKRSGVIT